MRPGGDRQVSALERDREAPRLKCQLLLDDGKAVADGARDKDPSVGADGYRVGGVVVVGGEGGRSGWPIRAGSGGGRRPWAYFILVGPRRGLSGPTRSRRPGGRPARPPSETRRPEATVGFAGLSTALVRPALPLKAFGIK